MFHEKANPEEAETSWLTTELPSQTGLKNTYMYICIGILKVISGPAVILVTTPLGSSKEQMMILKLFSKLT